MKYFEKFCLFYINNNMYHNSIAEHVKGRQVEAYFLLVFWVNNNRNKIDKQITLCVDGICCYERIAFPTFLCTHALILTVAQRNVPRNTNVLHFLEHIRPKKIIDWWDLKGSMFLFVNFEIKRTERELFFLTYLFLFSKFPRVCCGFVRFDWTALHRPLHAILSLHW